MEALLVVPSRIRSAATLAERSTANEELSHLRASDSAFCAMTDFRREYPITVEMDASIDDAFGDMNRLGVHSLLVTRREIGGIGQQIVGLITYYDIERRWSHRHPRTPNSGAHSGISVGEVMTPWNELSLIKYESLQTLTALDVHEMFQGTGLTHLLVIETHGDEPATAIGLVSRTTLAKRLQATPGAGSP